ncbi:MAG: valine--tRNA ligase, partial [Candidatus Dadabacteria bacterium]
MEQFPKKYKTKELENFWANKWVEDKIFKWVPPEDNQEVFTVDTPPPTVSGSLHLGHVFSYTHTDVIVRFNRMRGKRIFYPMGWDDNGLPTERRVQNYYGIKCDPSKPYDANFRPQKTSETNPSKFIPVSRKNFIEACHYLTKEDEKAFKALWVRLGLSVDWDLEYATIDKKSQHLSQYSFIELYEKGFLYHSLSPTMWDTEFQSAIAQAEVEDREMEGAFYSVKFSVEGGEDFIIATTRPELIGACIAVIAHPEDERYQHLFGKFAITPLFFAKVPILPSAEADPEKGTGIMMICTFGDIMDVEWWKSSGKPIKQLITQEGRIANVVHGEAPFESEDPEKANAFQAQLTGLTIKEAKKKIVNLLKEEGSLFNGGSALVGEPKKIRHIVKFFEKGSVPLEFIPTRQWYIKILEYKDIFIEQGRKINWVPEYMRARYEDWVNGLNQDWCISRQRYFGVPIPVWYPLDKDGNVLYEQPIFPEKESLPIDPASDTPLGYTDEARNKAGGFIADSDVLDTWATSSLTPQIGSGWFLNQELHSQVFPNDIRPQAHDIIRTWAFYTIVKAWMHEKSIPWRNIVISGFVLDPYRKKMSKSKGNVVLPNELIEENSADGVRYWASRARLGVDTALDETIFKLGRRLVTKLYNTGRFVSLQINQANLEPQLLTVDKIISTLDKSYLLRLSSLINKTTKELEAFSFGSALSMTEDYLWDFCDNYLELSKGRAYQDKNLEEKYSALATLLLSLNIYLRLFAPYLPFVSEEIWKHLFSYSSSSVHTAAWPKEEELTLALSSYQDLNSYKSASLVLSAVRGEKTKSKVSLKWPLKSLTIRAAKDVIEGLKLVSTDIANASNVALNKIEFVIENSLDEIKTEAVLE